MKKIALFLNGEKPENIPDLDNYAGIYCVDGAFNYLQVLNITPDLIMGDFDSIEQLPGNIQHIHTPDQNFTDFEKALKIIISQGYKCVDVFAANGLEQDHFLGNMTTALKYKNQLNLKFYDDRQVYYFIKKNTVISDVKNKMISLFPFPKAKHVTSTGLKYPLNNLNLNMKKNRLGTRNMAIDEKVTIQFNKGNLLLFIEND
ncbi:MAG: thiamine diphosphokinase [Alcanivoracaceae bacterium]|nr:thiamine diphosphokinase [Alcanivoracaceae bacterium]